MPFENTVMTQEAQASISLTKDVLVELLVKLEGSMKTDIAATRADLGQVLNRVKDWRYMTRHVWRCKGR